MYSTAKSKLPKAISKVDVICDFLEVYIHAILYYRKVYPQTLFEDRSAYGIPVKSSRHPELNAYILDLVMAIKTEIEKEKSPGDVLIDILDSEGDIIESFVLELSMQSGDYEPGHDIELRSALIRMSTLDPAPDLPNARDGSMPSLKENAWMPRLDKNGAGGGATANTPSRLVPLSSVDSAELKLMQMMEGPPVSATGNGAPTNGMYAQQQQSPVQQAPVPMNGGPAQYSGVAAVSHSPEDSTNSRGLYVGNLDQQATEQILFEVFSSVCPVMSVKIIVDKRQPQGGLNYGFVEFANHQDAELALQTLNGYRIIDSEIRVNWAYTSGTQGHEDTSSHFPVFVGDLSSEVNDQVLAKAFSVYPSMSDARVMWDMVSGKSRGYGFVTFRDRADAEMSIGQMNGEWLGSRAIRVNWANQKVPSRVRQDAQSLQPMQSLSFDVVQDMTAQYNTTVYVGNLTNYTTHEQLQAMFQPFGVMVEVRMQVERGFAFIKMDTHKSAAMAITQLHGTPLNGRPIKCSWGKDRHPDPQAAFGAVAAAAAANPAYTYPYVYGVPQQQFGVANANQQPPSANNPQAWSNFAYESYGAYYANPSYPQPGQMMPPATLGGAPNVAPGAMPGSSHASQTPEGGY
ncbi:E3 ubiquitin-protein ligase pub1 [Coemansia sp. RSA 720]|nr:E3 ubiquitin-protein ligase pub1 [Coemansia sp. RSA 720]